MSEEQRRRNPRYAFIANAELFEPVTRMQVATRVSELSVQGCYLDMLNPFPEDTIALVKISVGKTVFKQGAGRLRSFKFGRGIGISGP